MALTKDNGYLDIGSEMVNRRIVLKGLSVEQRKWLMSLCLAQKKVSITLTMRWSH